MKSRKVYFITIISPYEEVFKEKKINLKKMDSELLLLKKTKLSYFLKKIRRRQIISNHLKQSVDVYNPHGKQLGFRKSRTMTFFFSKKEAEKAIRENYSDLLEGGSWGSPTFAVIEEYHDGFCLVKNRWFYSINFYKNNYIIKKIKDPIWSEGTVNYAL